MVISRRKIGYQRVNMRINAGKHVFLKLKHCIFTTEVAAVLQDAIIELF